MIDRASRNTLALAIRRLGAGRITTDEFDDIIWMLPDTDRGVEQVRQAFWCMYSDLWSERFRGSAGLTRRARRLFARAYLFLRSDDEYVFDEYLPGVTAAPLRRRGALHRLANIDVCPRCLQRSSKLQWLRNLRTYGSVHRTWPFSTSAKLQAARHRPTLLCG